MKPFTSGIDYWIIFEAIKGRGEDGYVAIDNLDFLKETSDCPTIPAMAQPVVCQPGQIECGDHTCISEVDYFVCFVCRVNFVDFDDFNDFELILSILLILSFLLTLSTFQFC